MMRQFLPAGLLTCLWRSFPRVLLLFWGLSSIAALVALVPCGWLTGFRNAVMLSACRGKMWERHPDNALGRFTEWTVPQAWFAHFYDIGIIATILTTYVTFQHYGISQGSLILTFSLLLLHLVRRCLETHYKMHFPVGARMHIIAYLFGLVYYVVLPLTCLPQSIFQDEALFHVQDKKSLLATRAHYIQRPCSRQKLGAIIFLLGNALQYHSHSILAALGSKAKGQGSQGGHYSIPKGGAFELVSCPHYLAEMIIYLGLTLTLDVRRIQSWLPLVWVPRCACLNDRDQVSNLLLAAGPTHSWYRRKFDAYPKKRKAIIPFVY